MPGIAGIIGRASPDECQRLVGAMVDSMKHDCSYASGTHFSPEIGVFGGWVAHAGSFAARQSASSGCNDAVLLFSGECFPTSSASDQQRARERNGGNRDADRLLRTYETEGSSFVAGLNGLFSGLLVDRKRKRALLFNDRYGIERIYWHERDGAIYFASEAKALLRVLPESRAFDDEGVAQFLSYGCTLDGRTLFRNVRLLPAGSLWAGDHGACIRKSQYFHPKEWESQPRLGEHDFDATFLATCKRALPRYLSSETGIGVSLTGGLDTRMIMACIAGSQRKPPVCYTFSGLTERTLDVRLAADVARICALEHQTLRIGANFLSDYGRYVDRTVYATDGCAGALGAHEIYLNALARDLSPIRLTGNFGSEILRGMSTFKPIGLRSALIDASFGATLDASAKGVSERDVHPVTFAAFREIPWHLFGTLAAAKSQLTIRTPYLDNEIVELAYRAPAGARQSPRAALRLVHDNDPELGRIATDRGLVWGARTPANCMRRLFSAATFKLDYLHKEGLPHWLSPLDPLVGSLSKLGLLGLHKFLPYRTWFRRELAAYIGEVVGDASVRRLPFWNARFLTSMVAEHVSGRRNYVREIDAVLTLEAADRLLIRGSMDRQP